MDRPHHLDAPQVVETIHGVRRGRAQADDHARVDGLELGSEPGTARLDLFCSGLLVEAAFAALLELEMLHRVRDVNVGARQAGALERLVQNAARGPDEDGARAVLGVAGLLADQKQAGASRPLPEDRLRRGQEQRTTPTASSRLPERGE